MPHLLSDRWTLDDTLDFSPVADTLAAMLSAGDAATPLKICITGDLGSGRTSMLRMVEACLREKATTVWFDAAAPAGKTALWISLAQALLTALPDTSASDAADAREALRNDLAQFERESVSQSLDFEGDALLRGGLAALQQFLKRHFQGQILEEVFPNVAFNTEDLELFLASVQEAQVREMDAALERRTSFSERLATYLATEVPSRPIILFIDHLDQRPAPLQQAFLQALDAHVFVPGCIFIFTATSLPPLFAPNLIVRIPRSTAEQRYRFIRSLPVQWPDQACAEIFAKTLNGTPRRIKQIINDFLFAWARTRGRGATLSPVLLARLFAFKYRLPSLYRTVHADPQELPTLMTGAQASDASEAEVERLRNVFASGGVEKGQDSFQQASPEALARYLNLTGPPD